MQTVLLSRGSSSWEVTWDGPVLEVCSDGAVDRMQLGSAREAEEIALRLVDDHRDAGWGDGPADPPPLPPLPDLNTDEGRLVWGDQLQDREDPRGELIAVQYARLQRPDDAALANRERTLLEHHGPHFLGLAAWFRDLVEIEWHLGLIRSLRVVAEPLCDVYDLVSELLDNPSCRMLRTLRVETESGHELESALRAVATSGAPELHELIVRSFGYNDCPSLGPAIAACPALVSLELQCELEELPPLPRGLRRLVVHRDVELEGLASSSLVELGVPTDCIGEARDLLPGVRISEAVEASILMPDSIEYDHYEEDVLGGDALESDHRQERWGTWHYQQAVVPYQEEPAEESGMPKIGRWAERGEPQQPEDDDDDYFYESGYY